LAFIVRIYHDARSSECQILKRRKLIPVCHDCKFQDSLRISLWVSQVPDAIMGHFTPLHLFCVTKTRAQQSHTERHVLYFLLLRHSLERIKKENRRFFPPALL